MKDDAMNAMRKLIVIHQIECIEIWFKCQ